METVLEVERVLKKFGGLVAVNEVTFSVKKGEVFGIIGPNGSGKTTLLNLISNLDPPNSGKILFREKNIVGYPPNKISKIGLARTFQSTVSFGESTVLENMVRAQIGHCGLSLISQFLMTKSAIEKVKIIDQKAKDLINFFNLESWTDIEAKALPYGYQKLLGIAIALAGSPTLIMLDEPAAGLNTDEKLQLVKTINQTNKNGITIMLVEHDMKVIMGLCHRIMVMNYGKVIALGTPSEIQKNDEVIKAYLGEEHE